MRAGSSSIATPRGRCVFADRVFGRAVLATVEGRAPPARSIQSARAPIPDVKEVGHDADPSSRARNPRVDRPFVLAAAFRAACRPLRSRGAAGHCARCTGRDAGAGLSPAAPRGGGPRRRAGRAERTSQSRWSLAPGRRAAGAAFDRGSLPTDAAPGRDANRSRGGRALPGRFRARSLAARAARRETDARAAARGCAHRMDELVAHERARRLRPRDRRGKRALVLLGRGSRGARAARRAARHRARAASLDRRWCGAFLRAGSGRSRRRACGAERAHWPGRAGNDWHDLASTHVSGPARERARCRAVRASRDERARSRRRPHGGASAARLAGPFHGPRAFARRSLRCSSRARIDRSRT